MPLFDLSLGRAQREAGMRLASTHRGAVLHAARAIAVRVAQGRADRCVTADDVYRHLGAGDKQRLGNAAGSLFRGGRWEFTGHWKHSRRITNHARDIKIWRLRADRAEQPDPTFPRRVLAGDQG